MNIEDIASVFFQAKEKFHQASLKTLENHSENWQDYLSARDEYALAKQQLALAKGEEYVINYDIGCIPDLSDSREIALQLSQKTFLVFKALSPKISPTGTYQELGTAVISCQECLISQFGYPDEENLSKHILFSKGLDECLGVGEVVNSLWQIAIMEKYSIFPRGDITKSAQQDFLLNEGYKHFIFALKDNTFECIAKDLVVTFSPIDPVGIMVELANKYT